MVQQSPSPTRDKEEWTIPEVSRFYGIVILMYFNDHAPPHFYARYGADQVIVGIADLRILRGTLPPRALGLVMEWAALNRSRLLRNRRRARTMIPLVSIPPLN